MSLSLPLPSQNQVNTTHFKHTISICYIAIAIWSHHDEHSHLTTYIPIHEGIKVIPYSVAKRQDK